MEDFQRPENILWWYWREGDPEEDPESVLLTLADIDEMIKRAPVPLGDENFLIMIRQFGTTDKVRVVRATSSFCHRILLANGQGNAMTCAFPWPK